jgi:4,5-DOPA dioxygenase extradiol
MIQPEGSAGKAAAAAPGRIVAGVFAPNGPNLIVPGAFGPGGHETVRALRSLDLESRSKANVIVVASPHFGSRGPFLVLASPQPAFIEDFYGLPAELYGHTYAPPGDPELAAMLADEGRRAGLAVQTTTEWGLDHGAWTALMYLAPSATIPVVALSITGGSPEEHMAWGGAVAKAVERSGRRAALVATGLNLHDFARIDPSGRQPAWLEGWAIEREILDLMLASQPQAIASFDPVKWRLMQPEGDHRTYFILAGALSDGFSPRLVSNERLFNAPAMSVIEFSPADVQQ